jgi:hypothetical protein
MISEKKIKMQKFTDNETWMTMDAKWWQYLTVRWAEK